MEKPEQDAAATTNDQRASAQRMVLRLARTGAFPTRPWVARAALERARAHHAGVDALCEVLRADLGLAARILRLANTSARARSRAIARLDEAVLEIGLRKTEDVLVAADAHQLAATGSDRVDALLVHAELTALAAEEIARQTGGIDPGDAYLVGLFHDAGRLAFDLSDEAALAEIEARAGGGEAERAALERRRFGGDHASASALLARGFGLAPAHCEAIRRHHDVASAGAGERGLTIQLEIADCLAEELASVRTHAAAPYAVLADIGIDADEGERLRERIRGAFETRRSFAR